MTFPSVLDFSMFPFAILAVQLGGILVGLLVFNMDFRRAWTERKFLTRGEIAVKLVRGVVGAAVVWAILNFGILFLVGFLTKDKAVPELMGEAQFRYGVTLTEQQAEELLVLEPFTVESEFPVGPIGGTVERGSTQVVTPAGDIVPVKLVWDEARWILVQVSNNTEIQQVR